MWFNSSNREMKLLLPAPLAPISTLRELRFNSSLRIDLKPATSMRSSFIWACSLQIFQRERPGLRCSLQILSLGDVLYLLLQLLRQPLDLHIQKPRTMTLVACSEERPLDMRYSSSSSEMRPTAASCDISRSRLWPSSSGME